MAYQRGAEKFYDIFGAKDDARFYLDLALKHGGKALELGVGTGRLAIQLARSGVETWGIDNSPYMLRAAAANLEREPQNVRERVRLELADVRRFDLGERFGLICFPSFSFDHLLTHADQISTLECIRKHLTPSGVYAFDLVRTLRSQEEDSWFVEEKPLGEKRTVVRLGFSKPDPPKRLISIDLWYEVYEEGAMLERYHERGKVFVHDPESIKGLLEEVGFEVEAWYGGHDKQPFVGDSKLMVIVATPRT